MDYCLLTAAIVLLSCDVSCGTVEKTDQTQGLMKNYDIKGYANQNLNKRSVSTIPIENNFAEDDDGISSETFDNELDKRGTLFRFGKRQKGLFRFGKRQGSLFRFGKRQGSLFRFGKRQGSLFRFGKRQGLFRYGKRGSLFRFGKRNEPEFQLGKRGGSLFRFGRSESQDVPFEDSQAEKRTIFRYGKRSDLDVIRDTMSQNINNDRSSEFEDIDSIPEIVSSTEQ